MAILIIKQHMCTPNSKTFSALRLYSNSTEVLECLSHPYHRVYIHGASVRMKRSGHLNQTSFDNVKRNCQDR